MAIDKKLVLTVGGLIGFGVTVYFAGKDTIKAKKIYDKDQRIKRAEAGIGGTPEKEDKLELIKKYGKYYIPTIVAFAASSACVIGAYKLSVSEIAALSATAAGVISQRDKIEAEARKQFGDDAVDKFKRKFVSDEARDMPVDHIYDTGRGKQLCYEGILGTWFYSSEEDVKKALVTIKDQIKEKNYVSMNDVYEQFGIKRQCQLLRSYGWAPTQDGEDPYIPDFHLCHGTDDNGLDVLYVEVRDPFDMPIFEYWKY